MTDERVLAEVAAFVSADQFATGTGTMTTGTGAVVPTAEVRRWAGGSDGAPWLCEAHHIVDWADGGPTAVTNGTLLCPYHHRNVEQLGWTCRYLDRRAAWTAPPGHDPERRPRINTAHDPRAG